MYDTDVYLRRLGQQDARPDLATLVALHKRHLETIPFSSTGSLAVPTASGVLVELVDFDEDATFDSVVAAGNGGGCVQMTRLFLRLLRDIGFDTDLIAGTTAEGLEVYGSEVEHMAIMARVDGTPWLVDIGYAGPSFLEPLRLDVTGRDQTQYGCRYRLEEDRDGVLLRRRPKLGQWSTVYRFTTKPRDRSDWAVAQERVNAAVAAAGVGGTELHSRAVADGQVVLKGRRYLTVQAGIEKTRTVLDDDEWHALRTAILRGEIKRDVSGTESTEEELPCAGR